MSELAVIILNWNGNEDTKECLKSIEKEEDINSSIFVVENGSSEKNAMDLKKWIASEYRGVSETIEPSQLNMINFEKKIYLVESKQNLGFAKGNNLVWSKIKEKFEYVLLLNNDTVLEQAAISKMIEYLKRNTNVGALSCDIRYFDNKDKLWNAGGFFTFYGERKYHSQSKIDEFKSKKIEAIETPFITGCAMLVRKSTAKRIGIFTEKFFFGEEDFNYCKKMQKNNILVQTLLSATIFHKVSSSAKKERNIVGGYALHFVNRILNQKEFMSKIKWLFWREFYLCAIYFKVLSRERTIHVANEVVKNVRLYSNQYDEINYETFLEIIKLNK